MKDAIIVSLNLDENLELVWDFFTKAEHIQNWYFASDDWHCAKAENNLFVGKKFSYRMEAKDGSMGFDFSGVYTEIVPYEKIAYVLDDTRKVEIIFLQKEQSVFIQQRFEPENENTYELQQYGWQSILNNFKNYIATNKPQ